MSCIYEIKIHDPNGVGWMPPTIINSEWFKNIINITSENSFIVPQYRDENGGRDSNIDLSGWRHVVCIYIKFNDISEMTQFLDKHVCKDEALLADMKVWKESHNITFKTNCYTIVPIELTTPMPILFG